MSVNKMYCAIHRLEIYPVDSITRPLNKKLKFVFEPISANRTYSSFLLQHEGTRSITTPFWMGPSAFCHASPTIYQYSFIFLDGENTTLEPRPLDLKFNKLTLRSLRLCNYTFTVPNISVHILHTVLCTYTKVLTRRICLIIKGFFSL